MYYRYKKEVQSLKNFCQSVNLKVHWKVTDKVPEIRMSVNIHWVFLGLKKRVSILCPIKKRCKLCSCFCLIVYRIQIDFKLVFKFWWLVNSGDKFPFVKDKNSLSIIRFVSLMKPEVTYERFKNSLNVWFLFFGFISLSSGTHHNIAFIAHAVERYCFEWFCFIHVYISMHSSIKVYFREITFILFIKMIKSQHVWCSMLSCLAASTKLKKPNFLVNIFSSEFNTVWWS